MKTSRHSPVDEFARLRREAYRKGVDAREALGFAKAFRCAALQAVKRLAIAKSVLPWRDSPEDALILARLGPYEMSADLAACCDAYRRAHERKEVA